MFLVILTTSSMLSEHYLITFCFLQIQFNSYSSIYSKQVSRWNNNQMKIEHHLEKRKALKKSPLVYFQVTYSHLPGRLGRWMDYIIIFNS